MSYFIVFYHFYIKVVHKASILINIKVLLPITFSISIYYKAYLLCLSIYDPPKKKLK